METGRVALASAIAAVFCCVFWKVIDPEYGIAAGLAAGYLSFRFRAVLGAIPSAWSETLTELDLAREDIIQGCSEVRAWLKRAHPFVYPSIFATCVTGWVLVHRWITPLKEWYIAQGRSLDRFDVATLFMVVAILCYLVSLSLFVGFAFLGARKWEKCYWYPFLMIEEGRPREKHEKEDLERDGLQQKPLTYANVFRWAGKGVLMIAFPILKFFWIVLSGLCLFLLHLAGIIYSKERVLCAIWGTTGGVIACVALAPASLLEYLAFFVFGGLLGGVLGVFNYEILSKRIFHVAQNGA